MKDVQCSYLAGFSLKKQMAMACLNTALYLAKIPSRKSRFFQVIEILTIFFVSHDDGIIKNYLKTFGTNVLPFFSQ